MFTFFKCRFSDHSLYSNGPKVEWSVDQMTPENLTKNFPKKLGSQMSLCVYLPIYTEVRIPDKKFDIQTRFPCTEIVKV